MTNTNGIDHRELEQIYFIHTVFGNKTKFVTGRGTEPSSTQCQKAYVKIFTVVK